jgi:hypothetical protein
MGNSVFGIDAGTINKKTTLADVLAMLPKSKPKKPPSRLNQLRKFMRKHREAMELEFADNPVLERPGNAGNHRERKDDDGRGTVKGRTMLMTMQKANNHHSRWPRHRPVLCPRVGHDSSDSVICSPNCEKSNEMLVSRRKQDLPEWKSLSGMNKPRSA